MSVVGLLFQHWKHVLFCVFVLKVEANHMNSQLLKYARRLPGTSRLNPMLRRRGLQRSPSGVQ